MDRILARLQHDRSVAELLASQEIVGMPQQETPFCFRQSHLRDRPLIATPARASLIQGTFIPVVDRLQALRPQFQWILGWAGSWAYLSSGGPLHERNQKAIIPRPIPSTLSGLLSQCSCERVIHCIGRRDAVEAESAGMYQSSHLHSLRNCRLYLRGRTSWSYNWTGARSEHGDQPLALRD